jgi:hypothetical protein
VFARTSLAIAWPSYIIMPFSFDSWSTMYVLSLCQNGSNNQQSSTYVGTREAQNGAKFKMV